MMRDNGTNNRQFSGFPPVPEPLPAPPEAVWDGIRRGMKRKDFWRVKGKVLATALLCASATALFFAVNTGSDTPQPAGTAALAPATTPDTSATCALIIAKRRSAQANAIQPTNEKSRQNARHLNPFIIR